MKCKRKVNGKTDAGKTHKMSAPKATNVEKVLPNDEDLGRRNCRWRELIKKYEVGASKEIEHSMDIDTVIGILDQNMSSESSVSDVEEDSSRNESAEENPEDIRQQLKVALPMRKRTWEANGLKEILDDQEFRMLSQEKVENWLRNHKHTITGHYNVHYQTQEVTTVTETCMDADADSLYSVDTAQYIRSNKQISNKVKVTTMIKQYAVTGSIRHGRVNSVGSIYDDHLNGETQRMSLPQFGRLQSKSESSCEGQKPLPVHALPLPNEQRHVIQRDPLPLAANSTRRTRKKVFKKTLPRKRPAGSGEAVRHQPLKSSQVQYDQREVYEKALEQCARTKKAKARRTPLTRKAMRRNTNRWVSSTSSPERDNRDDDSENNDVFSREPSRHEKPSVCLPRKNLFPSAAEEPTSTRSFNSSEAAPPKIIKPASTETSPSEREIVDPFQSITLSTCKQKRPQSDVSVHSGCTDSKSVQGRDRPRKRIGMQADGCYHDEGLVIYRPKTIQPHLPTSERIVLRMKDLTLDGVEKERHLTKFRDFHYRVHPNSTVCFYPSESDSDEGPENQHVRPGAGNSDTENSYDDDDPILNFHPRKTKLLNVVEVPYRRRVN